MHHDISARPKAPDFRRETALGQRWNACRVNCSTSVDLSRTRCTFSTCIFQCRGNYCSSTWASWCMDDSTRAGNSGHDWYVLPFSGSPPRGRHSTANRSQQQWSRTHPDQWTYGNHSVAGPPTPHRGVSGIRGDCYQEPRRPALPHRLPAPEHAPARTPLGHLLQKYPPARQARRPRGPQHRPHRPGTHRG